MGRRKNLIWIYNYIDYRKYLADYYRIMKAKRKGFTYRTFLSSIGVTSSAFLINLIKGYFNLNSNFILKISKAIGLRPKESQYFENMVLFTQAKTVEEKIRYFERMLQMFPPYANKAEPIQYKFFSRWYNEAIREVLTYYKFKNDYIELALMFDPPVRHEYVKSSISVMEQLGFIHKDKDGIYHKVDQVLTPAPEIESMLISGHDLKMMDLAKESIDRFPPEACDISSLTLSVSQDIFEEIKKELMSLRKKIVALSAKANHLDRVYQLNFQLFPLTVVKQRARRPRKKKEGTDSDHPTTAEEVMPPLNNQDNEKEFEKAEQNLAEHFQKNIKTK